jgi:hypothetical protein
LSEERNLTHHHTTTLSHEEFNEWKLFKVYVVIFGKNVKEEIGFIFCDCFDNEFFIRREDEKASTASLRELVIRKTPHKTNWVQR